MADTTEPDLEALRKHVGAISDQVNALQQFNRRVLERLRPVGLAELGLADALAALLRLWRETHPGVVIETSISPSLGARGETAELTIYRIIQEALTNVFRHARATRVDITRRAGDVRPAGAVGDRGDHGAAYATMALACRPIISKVSACSACASGCWHWAAP